MITVAIPAFNEAEAIPRLYEEICGALSTMPDADELQLVFVDDGSTDGTAAQIDALAVGDPSVRRISFGMTTRPRSSIRRTIPVAFMLRVSLSCFYAVSLCKIWGNMRASG